MLNVGRRWIAAQDTYRGPRTTQVTALTVKLTVLSIDCLLTRLLDRRS
jgi:hypothetical protein